MAQNESKNRIVQLCGDAPDPAGIHNHGVASGVNFTNTAFRKPVVLYKDRLLTLDYYRMPGAPDYVMVFCPLCQMRKGVKLNEGLRISQDNKAISLEPDAYPHAVAKKLGMSLREMAQYLSLSSIEDLRGVVDIEAFGCTWEEEPELRRGFGLGVCKWRVKITNNIAVDV